MLTFAAAVLFLIVTPGPGALSAVGVGSAYGMRHHRRGPDTIPLCMDLRGGLPQPPRPLGKDIRRINYAMAAAILAMVVLALLSTLFAT